jgi:hypothetical protein
MRNTISLSLLTALCLTTSSCAAKPEIPKVIADGFSAYQTSGSKDALALWLKGSPVENDAATSANMNGLLSQVEKAYGKMSGFELIRTVPISPSVQRIYIVIRFERGPLYALFDCFKPSLDKANPTWIVNNLECNIAAKAILPPALLEGSLRPGGPQ